MEQQSRFKQRLVGAMVLVALGVIFIPMILNGEREPGFIVNGSSIPAKPAEVENIRQLEFVTAEPATAPDSPRSRADDIRIPVDERSAPLSSSKQAVAPARKTKADKVITRPNEQAVAKKKKPSMASATHAWAVQVGSFKQKNNALKLRDSLRKEKYKAFVEGVRSNNKLVYRVRLGPYVSRSGAEQVREKLLARQKMKGLVVKHP